MKFTLRPWHVSDIDNLVKIANNYKIAKNLTNKFPFPYTRESGNGFIAFANQHDPLQINAIDIDGIAIGAIGIHPQNDVMCKNAEIGFWLDESYWGQGIMSQAVNRMIGYGFENFDINRIYGRVYHTNIGSQKVLEKCGFILEAQFEKTIYKFDEYLDEWVYAIRRK